MRTVGKSVAEMTYYVPDLRNAICCDPSIRRLFSLSRFPILSRLHASPFQTHSIGGSTATSKCYRWGTYRFATRYCRTPLHIVYSTVIIVSRQSFLLKINFVRGHKLESGAVSLYDNRVINLKVTSRASLLGYPGSAARYPSRPSAFFRRVWRLVLGAPHHVTSRFRLRRLSQVSSWIKTCLSFHRSNSLRRIPPSEGSFKPRIRRRTALCR